jgi:hypothetical protein
MQYLNQGAARVQDVGLRCLPNDDRKLAKIAGNRREVAEKQSHIENLPDGHSKQGNRRIPTNDQAKSPKMSEKVKDIGWNFRKHWTPTDSSEITTISS